jgi:hypothetical protein
MGGGGEVACYVRNNLFQYKNLLRIYRCDPTQEKTEDLTWHVTIVSYKTHKWKQLDSVLKGQTSY